VNQFGRTKPDYATMPIEEIEKLPIDKISRLPRELKLFFKIHGVTKF